MVKVTINDIEHIIALNANLRDANPYEAILKRVDLRGADLRWADLRGANLRGANLQEADLQEANLQGANLQGANLQEATVLGANFQGADLRGAKNIPAIIAARLFVPPQEGSFIAFKKLYGGIICKLMIPAEARRSSATTRKCRAEFAIVLEGKGRSTFDLDFVYEVGKTVRADYWEENRWVECGGGIHFFMTREEAEYY